MDLEATTGGTSSGGVGNRLSLLIATATGAFARVRLGDETGEVGVLFGDVGEVVTIVGWVFAGEE